MKRVLLSATVVFCVTTASFAAKTAKEEAKKDEGPLSSATFAGLALSLIHI